MADWQRYQDSRQFPGACPIGPTIITRDEFGEPGAAIARVSINEVEVSVGALWPNDHDPARSLAEVSQRQAFRPGDLVSFAGESLQTHKLHPGDSVAIEFSNAPALTAQIS